MPTLDCTTARNEISLLQDCVYLNTGTEGLLAEPVLANYQAALARQERQGHVALEWRYTQSERAREAVARVLHTHPATIAFTRNATDGHNIVLHGLPWQPGDELLISNQEHPALTHPAAYLQNRGGPTVRVFAIDTDPQITMQNIRAALGPKTRLIAFSQVSCESGIRLPAKEICQLAHEHGAWALVDGAQSLGAIPVDVTDMNCDFFVSNGHKWLCGPKGTGILYVRLDRLDSLAIRAVGAGTFEDFNWSGEDFRLRLKPDARRFEFGTRNQAALAGLHAAIAWLEELGFSNVFAHIRDLAQQAHRILAESPGVEVLTPRSVDESAGIVTFLLNGKQPSEVSQALWQQGIITRHTTTPPGVRASAAYFNNEQDFERLAAALSSIV